MYQTTSKRRQTIMRVAIYSFMTAAVIILVTLLVFVMLGFRFNKATSSIQQGGLVQFASRPDSANVTIGNAKLSAQTPSKITVDPGHYEVKMAKKGYLDWNKSINARAGEVLWLNYAQLVPQKITTKQQTHFDAISDVKSSPNGDRFAIIQDPSKPIVTFADVTGTEPKIASLTIPAGFLPTGKSAHFALGEWSYDSDHLLVTMSYDSTVERLLINRTDAAKTINLSKSYESDIADIKFDPRSTNRLIIVTAKGDVRTIDTSNDSLSSIIASSVTSMSFYENDAILLTQTVAEGGQQVSYVSLGSDNLKVIKRISSNAKVLVAAADYFSEPHLAISVGNQLDVYKVPSLPSSSSDSSISMSRLFSTSLAEPATFLSIRSGGRFVVAQYGSGIQTYDLEVSKQSITSFTAPAVAETRWLDKYHFYITNGKSLEILEFDGANAHQIVDLTTGFDAVQSNDGKFIYTINADEKGFAIEQSRMILQ
jgi:hypothetical protein